QGASAGTEVIPPQSPFPVKGRRPHRDNRGEVLLGGHLYAQLPARNPIRSRLLACLNRAVKNFGSTAPSLASASLRFFRIGVTNPPPPSCPYFSRSSEPAAHGSASLKASPTACPASPNSRPATIPTASSTVNRSLYSVTRSRPLQPHLSDS